MTDQSRKQSSEMPLPTAAKHPIPSYRERGVKQKSFILLAGGLLLILLVSSAYYFGLQTSTYNGEHEDTAPVTTQSPDFGNSEENQKLVSPADSTKLEYTTRLTTGLYIGGTPVDVFYEQYGDLSEGRIAVYHAWNQITDRNEGAFIVDNESQGPCLDKLLPITKSDGMRFITEYSCGDAQQLKITSFSFKPGEDIRDLKVQNLETFNLLNDYFSSIYQKSFVKVIGWQDFDHLLVDQIFYSEGQLNSITKKKHEIYIFDVNDKSKKLIYTIEE